MSKRDRESGAVPDEAAGRAGLALVVGRDGARGSAGGDRVLAVQRHVRTPLRHA